jgi:hypothetical protein
MSRTSVAQSGRMRTESPITVVLRIFGCIAILGLCTIVTAASIIDVRARSVAISRHIGIGDAEDLAIANEVTHGAHGTLPQRRLRLIVLDRTTGLPATGMRISLPDTHDEAIVDPHGFAVLVDHFESRAERIEVHCPSGTPHAQSILHTLSVSVHRPRTDLRMRVDLANCSDHTKSSGSGRFDGIYHSDPSHPDWLFPCDGTQPFQVESSRELFRHAETIHQRFPGAFVRRNGVYLTALGESEISGERRKLDVRVILSMGPDRPADCRTPERDHAMASLPPLAYD